jgi:poly(3-hydroxybutyrate) depolymerase
MAKRSVSILVVIVLAMSLGFADASPAPGTHELVFSDWAGPQISVRVQLPQDFDAHTPIVVVMHGASRDMPRYFDDWSAQANTHGFIAVVPEFAATDFKGSARYNLGHVFDPNTGERRDEAGWTFSAIEPLFDHIVAWAVSEQSNYVLFGHSAGSQFVHRFLYYVRDARVSKAILANAGWYTMPDFGVDYPYGLSESGVDDDVLAGYFGQDVTVLLGDADIDTSDEDLRHTPEAELQGPHRLARGRTFFRVANAKAKALGVDFNWRIQIVPGAEHSNAQMTPAAAKLVVMPD